MWAFIGFAGAHIFVALGVLPAYRGVWRAMWGSGRVDRRLAQRLWPGWADREQAAQTGEEEGVAQRTGAPRLAARGRAHPRPK
jgi:hypothetical protein